jgi:hypothetical protein
MAYILNETTILDLPIHDASLKEIIINQNRIGNVVVALEVEFDIKEIIELPKEISQNINENGKALIILEDCENLTIQIHGNRTNEDEIDYIELVKNINKLKCNIYLISGSQLTCIISNAKIELKNKDKKKAG